MTRTTKPDPTGPEDGLPAKHDTPATEEAQPAPVAPEAPPAAADLYEPYPGAGFFHGGRNSPIVQAMAYRLHQEGHWNTAQSPGPDWTTGHKRAFAAFQHTLRPKGGGDTSGIPDEVAWDRLQVPRVTPLPKRAG
ncbi:peptidoglycan-binding protein [Streptomyces halstedii]|uniref:peptidoglycan-binding protein n=1 Tax=Streptomyces halstedii TaxID=1944 RepID=UPI0038008E9A